MKNYFTVLSCRCPTGYYWDSTFTGCCKLTSRDCNKFTQLISFKSIFKCHKRITNQFVHQLQCARPVLHVQQPAFNAIVLLFCRLDVVIALQRNIMMKPMVAVCIFVCLKGCLTCSRSIFVAFFTVNRVSHGGACTATYMCTQGINLMCSGTQCVCIDDYYWTGSTCGKF